MPAAWFILAILLIQACTPPAFNIQATPTALLPSREIPTWTPQVFVTAETFQAPTEPAKTNIPTIAPQTPTLTQGQTSILAVGGNLNIRRGPSVDYNTIGALYADEIAFVIGRDRVGRWLFVRSPSDGKEMGWISAQTEFSQINGSVDELPVMTAEPAVPALIRNCTKHVILIKPTQVQLLSKFNEPYNEERFSPGEYQVFDLDVSSDESIMEINLVEGSLVDVRLDGAGEKSKCSE